MTLAIMYIVIVCLLILRRVSEIFVAGQDHLGLPAWIAAIIWAVLALGISIHIWRGRTVQ